MLMEIAMQPLNILDCVPGNQRPYDDQALQTLADKVLSLAVKDAINGKPYDKDHAKYWLTSPDGAVWATLAGYDPAAVRAWVQAGCPQPTADQTKKKPAQRSLFLSSREMERIGTKRAGKLR